MSAHEKRERVHETPQHVYVLTTRGDRQVGVVSEMRRWDVLPDGMLSCPMLYGWSEVMASEPKRATLAAVERVHAAGLAAARDFFAGEVQS